MVLLVIIRFAMEKISVILNSYNQEEFFETAIKSVLAQTYENFELIISENGSTDSSKQIMAKYITNPKVVILDYPENDIIGKRFNQAIAKSSGNYICFLYSDDFIEKDKLRIQMEEFKKLDQEYGVIYCDVNIINEYSKINIKRNVIKCDGWCLKNQLDNIHIFGHIDMVSPMIKKDCLIKHKFLENIFAEGEGILLRIALDYKFKYIPKILANFRDTKFNKGKALLKNLEFHKETLNILKKNEIFHDIHYKNSLNKYIFYFSQNVAWGNLRANGNKSETIKIFLKLLKKKSIKFFNLKSFLILFIMPMPKFIIKLINYFINKIFKVRTNNIFIENYGGKNL